jgi:hypothetical protein
MALAPQNDRCSAFADYVLENYISSGAKFSPILWSEELSDRRRTTNGYNEKLKDAVYKIVR